MIVLHGNDYVYEVTPPFLGQQERLAAISRKAIAEDLENARKIAEQNDDTVRIGLLGISMVESDKLDMEIAATYNDMGREKASEIVQGKIIDQVANKVAYIKNLIVDGKELTTFKEIYPVASCRELVKWIQAAVKSTIILSAAERKNFLPE